MTADSKQHRKRSFAWWAKRVALFLFVLPIVGLILTFAYQQIATARSERLFQPPGELVNIGTHRLHIYCLGEGSPTVILEAGARSWSIIWSLVQADIAAKTRICAYDRAGFGWSEPGPRPRTAAQIAGELHALLVTAEVEGPYILVGHSFGGPLVRVFAAQYPADVVGVVLIDSTHPDQATRLPVDYMTSLESETARFNFLGQLARLGILRFGLKANVPTWTLPPDVIPAYYAFMARPEFYETSVAEESVLETSLTQARESGDLGDLPLIVIRANRFDDELASYPDVDAEAYVAMRILLQEELAALSTNGRLLVAEDSDHLIQLHQPDLVVEAILEMIDWCRGL